MASKLWVHEPDTFFLFEDTEISEKWNFLVNCSVPENFRWENCSGQVPTELSHADSIPRKIFPLKIFGYGALYKKIPFFTDFCVLKQKKKYRVRVPTILMPETFPIASLNPFAQTFRGYP